MVWFGGRNVGTNKSVYDTVRGATFDICTNLTQQQFARTTALTGFTTSGFTLGADTVTEAVNKSGTNYVSWTFREQPKFYDIVTYTGNGSAPRNISHNLDSSPGFIIIKRTDSTGDWWCWHRSIANKNIYLNYTDAADSGANPMISAVSSTNFTLATNQNATMNINGATYVAYLFAHDAGGFGLTGSDNVVSCGSYTGDGTSDGSKFVSLGYEPQWLLIKRSDSSTNGAWVMVDNMRGIVTSNSAASNDAVLEANSSATENLDGICQLSATGFNPLGGYSNINGATYIYIAIRRGPMKTPTSGTSVYEGTVRTGTGATASISGLAFPPDLVITRNRPSNLNDKSVVFDKLRGATKYLITSGTDAELTGATTLTSFNQTGESFGDAGTVNGNGDSYINWQFRRAPGFFDEVCYTGDGANTNNVSHNLGATPEMLIFKSRNNADNWAVFLPSLDIYIRLNSTSGKLNGSSLPSAATSTTFDVGNTTGYSSVTGAQNNSGYTYVAYLFASVSGVSKVGSYTGTGALQTVNCGFTGGARFVLIKRTDSTGDWYVYDSARGISSGNDPYLFLNSTAAEVTNTNYVDTTSVGFQVTAAAPAALNANGGTFLFFAIA